MSIMGNMVGGAAPLKTLIIQDENGNEMVGVVTGSEVIFSATDNDVREGSVYAGDAGVSTGTKIIPSYNTTEGYKVIPNGESYSITSLDYDYTRLQAVICAFNTTSINSVATEKVVLEDNVYDVNSTNSLATVAKKSDKNMIDFGIVNTSGEMKILRFFYYKEIY